MLFGFWGGRQESLFLMLSLGNSPANLAQLDSAAVSRLPIVISFRKGSRKMQKKRKDGRSRKRILANNSNKNHYVRRQLSSFHSLSLNTVEMWYLVAAAVLKRCGEFVRYDAFFLKKRQHRGRRFLSCFYKSPMSVSEEWVKTARKITSRCSRTDPGNSQTWGWTLAKLKLTKNVSLIY